MNSDTLPIGEALRYLRTRKGLSQSAVGRLPNGVDHKSLSHWETGRKLPLLRNVITFLHALDLDLHDLQDAFDAIGPKAGSTAQRVEEINENLSVLHQRLVGIERRISVVERRQAEGLAAMLGSTDLGSEG